MIATKEKPIINQHIFRRIWNLIKNKNSNNYNKRIMPEKKYLRNVYCEKEFRKQATFVHRILKNLIIRPCIAILSWYLKDKLKKAVPDVHQFKRLKILDECIDMALYKWNHMYRPNIEGIKCTAKSFMDDTATQTIRLIFDMYKTVQMIDTAYLEFNNILMNEIHLNMSKCKREHVFYTKSSIYDFNYFIITDGIEKGTINLQQMNGGGNMSDRDGKGPRDRSPKPSRPKGGDEQGGC